MYADLQKMKELHSQGLVHAHNFGPTPDIVIRLFETNPTIWRADLNDYQNEKGQTEHSIPIVEAMNRSGVYIMDVDVRNTITILGKHFDGCDAIKIQAGAEFGGYRRNRPAIIFLWWD